MKVDVWRAIFSDYRDLSKGSLHHKDTGPEVCLNLVADFEVVNKMHLDMALRRVEHLRDILAKVRKDGCENNGWERFIDDALKEDDEAAKC